MTDAHDPTCPYYKGWTMSVCTCGQVASSPTRRKRGDGICYHQHPAGPPGRVISQHPMAEPCLLREAGQRERIQQLEAELAAMTRDRNGWEDLAQKYKVEYDDARRERDEILSRANELTRRSAEVEAERIAVAAKLADATAYCSGEFPCEASTATAHIERAFNESEAERDTLALTLSRAHSCATTRDDGTCDGCFISDVLTTPGAARVLRELEALRRVEKEARDICQLEMYALIDALRAVEESRK